MMNEFSGQVLRSEIFQGPYKDNVYGDISLRILYLDHNEIHSLDRYLFKHTPNLTSLFLNNNPLETLDHVTVLAISSATNLQVCLLLLKFDQFNKKIVNVRKTCKDKKRKTLQIHNKTADSLVSTLSNSKGYCL